MDDPKSITLVKVKRAAHDFLYHYHPSLSLPVPIEDIVELQLSIRIVLIHGLIRDFGVNAFITQNFDSIVIDEAMFTKQAERIRFTIAEEIGHLFLHKEWYMVKGPKGFDDYLQWQEKLDRELFGYIERQAKTFASMVLMPEEVITEKWSDFAKRFGLSTPCSVYALPDTFPELARVFVVSPDSLLVRLSFLKLVSIPDGFWEKLKKR